MATARQIEANRLNALQSTGPRTNEGKLVSSGNALKHGLLAAATVLPEEDANEFASFAAALNTDLDPKGATEQLLVETLIASAWRLRRFYQLDSGVFRAALVGHFHGEIVSAVADISPRLSRYGASIERGFYRALCELRRLQVERNGQTPAPGTVVAVSIQVDGK